jgi:hypothetical protein
MKTFIELKREKMKRYFVYFPLPHAQGTSSQTHVPSPSDYFTPHYTTGGVHGSAIPTTNPTGGTFSGHHGSSILVANPTGSNITTGSNMTGTAGNTTGSNMTAAGNTTGAHGSSITTSHPAAYGSAKEFKEKIDAGILPAPSGPDVYVHHTGIKPSGAIVTSTSNMTGAAGNITHGSSITTSHPAGLAPGITCKRNTPNGGNGGCM